MNNRDFSLLLIYWGCFVTLQVLIFCYRHEFAVALDILLKDLKVFAQSNKELYKEMTQLLTLDDFRYVDVMCFAYLAFIIL